MGRPRRTSATTPRPAAAGGRASTASDSETAGGRGSAARAGDADASPTRSDALPSWSEVDRAGEQIAAAAVRLRHRLVMGRYAGFAAGFDAGLAMCSILDTLARDRGRDMRSQRLRLDALRLAHHVNQDTADDDEPIKGHTSAP